MNNILDILKNDGNLTEIPDLLRSKTQFERLVSLVGILDWSLCSDDSMEKVQFIFDEFLVELSAIKKANHELNELNKSNISKILDGFEYEPVDMSPEKLSETALKFLENKS